MCKSTRFSLASDLQEKEAHSCVYLEDCLDIRDIRYLRM